MIEAYLYKYHQSGVQQLGVELGGVAFDITTAFQSFYSLYTGCDGETDFSGEVGVADAAVALEDAQYIAVDLAEFLGRATFAVGHKAIFPV